jgi:hypothetical protein
MFTVNVNAGSFARARPILSVRCRCSARTAHAAVDAPTRATHCAVGGDAAAGNTATAAVHTRRALRTVLGIHTEQHVWSTVAFEADATVAIAVGLAGLHQADRRVTVAAGGQVTVLISRTAHPIATDRDTPVAVRICGGGDAPLVAGAGVAFGAQNGHAAVAVGFPSAGLASYFDIEQTDFQAESV